MFRLLGEKDRMFKSTSKDANIFYIDTLKAHEQSKYHDEAHTVATFMHNDSYPSHPALALRKLNASTLIKVPLRFRNAHAFSLSNYTNRFRASFAFLITFC